MTGLIERLRRGAVLYEVRTGQPIYAGPTALEREAADRIAALEAEASEGERRGLEREALARHMAAEYAQHEDGYDWELTDRIWQEGWRKAADRALAAIDAALIPAPAKEGE